jgi:hypothetical protein
MERREVQNVPALHPRWRFASSGLTGRLRAKIML